MISTKGLTFYELMYAEDLILVKSSLNQMRWFRNQLDESIKRLEELENESEIKTSD